MQQSQWATTTTITITITTTIDCVDVCVIAILPTYVGVRWSSAAAAAMQTGNNGRKL